MVHDQDAYNCDKDPAHNRYIIFIYYMVVSI